MILEDKEVSCQMDDAFLLRFLRARKFNHIRALEVLQKYYRNRSKYSTIFSDFYPSATKPHLEQYVTAILPVRDRLGRAILVFHSERWKDPKSSDINDMLRVIMMWCEKSLEDEETQINGLVYLGNAKGFTFKHMQGISLDWIKLCAGFIQDSFPLRFKAFHIINVNKAFQYFFSIMKLFLKEKIRERIFLYGSELDSLHSNFSPDTLPPEFGGNLNLDYQALTENLLKDEEKFIIRSRYGYKKK